MESTQPAIHPAPRPRGPSVLVVDDDYTHRALLRRTLTHDGYEVLTAEDDVTLLLLEAT